jgi:2-oxoacid:acceptor oxidoreductase delta subunit (pyruvate/2-ketoisovalerate family)
MDRKNYISSKCELKTIDQYQEKVLDVDERLRNKGVVRLTYNEDTARNEAGRCLANNFCDSCDLCRYFCPDLCITRNENTGQIEIDYDFCKGCGICAFICPKGAITMVFEE